MISLLKALIMVLALLAFIYAASLAMQGNLEAEIIMRDYITAKFFVINHLQLLTQSYFK